MKIPVISSFACSWQESRISWVIGEPCPYEYFFPSSYLLFSFQDITSDGVPELFVIEKFIWLAETDGLRSWDVYTYNGLGGFDFLETCEFYDPVQDVCYTETFGGDSEGFSEYRIDDQKSINWIYSITRAIADPQESGADTYSGFDYYREDNDGTHTELTEEEFNEWLEDHDRRLELYGIKESESFVLDTYALVKLNDNEEVWREDDKGQMDARSEGITYYERIYSSVLEEAYDIVKNGYDDKKKYLIDWTGLWERALYPEDAELLKTVGYVLMDISGDGVPELLIGENTNHYSGEIIKHCDIYSGFTCKDEKPFCFLEGWARNNYQWLGNDHFYYFGSGGADNNSFGECHLCTDGTKLIWDDFYILLRDGVYHNTTGIWDEKKSEELDNITDEEFNQLLDSYENYESELLPWISIEKYEEIQKSLNDPKTMDYMEMGETETDTSEDDFALFDSFLNNEIYAYYPDNFEYPGEPFKYEERYHGEDDINSLKETGRIDVNNDGKKDLVMEDYYGETYFYVKDGKLYVLAEPDGTAVRTSHTYYDGAEWIVIRDMGHGGRQSYWLAKYNGDGEIVDEFGLSAEYWDSPDYTYHEDSEFTFRDNPITMEEFERLRYEILGIGEPPEESEGDNKAGNEENSDKGENKAENKADKEDRTDESENKAREEDSSDISGEEKPADTRTGEDNAGDRENNGNTAESDNTVSDKGNDEEQANSEIHFVLNYIAEREGGENTGNDSTGDREDKGGTPESDNTVSDTRNNDENKYPAWDLDKDAEVKSILEWNEEMLENRSNYDFHDYGGYSYYSIGTDPLYIVVRAGYNNWEPSRYYYGYDIFYVEVEYSPARVRKYYFSGYKLFRVETEDGRVIDYGSKGWDKYNEEGLRLREERTAISNMITGKDDGNSYAPAGKRTEESLCIALYLGYLNYTYGYYFNSESSDDPDRYDRAVLLYNAEGDPALLIRKEYPDPHRILLTIDNDHVVENMLSEYECGEKLRGSYGIDWKERFDEYSYLIDAMKEELRKKLEDLFADGPVTYETACFKQLCKYLSGEQEYWGIGHSDPYNYFSPGVGERFAFKDITDDGIPELFVNYFSYSYVPDMLDSCEVYRYNGEGDFIPLGICEFYDPVKKWYYTGIYGDAGGPAVYELDENYNENVLYERDTESAVKVPIFRCGENEKKEELSEEEYNRWKKDYETGKERYGIREDESFILSPDTIRELSTNDQVWRGDQKDF